MSSRFPARYLCLLPLLPFTSTAAQSPGPAIRDSAGVRIVEHRTIKQAPRIRLASTPRLDLGGTRADLREEFVSGHEFLTVARFSDGRLAVNDRSALKIFDSAGKILQVVGRSGQGPGEFGLMNTVCVVRGDTIITGDGRRTTVFDREGALVRTYSAPANTYGVSRGGCFADGSLVIASRSVRNPALPPVTGSTFGRDQLLTVEHVGREGSLIASLGPFALPHFSLNIPNRTSILAYGDFLIVATGAANEYRVLTREGRLSRIVRWLDAPVPVTDSMVRSSPGGGCARGSVCNPKPALRPPQPTSLPAYYHVTVDPAGRVWVQDHILAPKPLGWTIFDASGALLGRLLLPELGTAHRAPQSVTTGVHIAGVYRDEVLLRWWDTTDGGVHLSFFPFTLPARR